MHTVVGNVTGRSLVLNLKCHDKSNTLPNTVLYVAQINKCHDIRMDALLRVS
jgi:hypothetical protein